MQCFRRLAPLCLTLSFVCGAGCTSVSSGAPSGTTSTAAKAASDSKGCVPVAEMSSHCPAEWTGVSPDREAFCSKKPHPSYSVFVSTAPCRGALHYVRYLFDAGPRHCLYDPATRKLIGYGAFDAKVSYSAWTCGHDRADFDAKGCEGLACPEPSDAR